MRHSVEFFFFFFFMYDILSKFFLFIFVVPNGLIFTVDYLHSGHAWRIFPGDYRAVLAHKLSGYLLPTLNNRGPDL